MGIQLYLGSQAVVIILSALIGPKFAVMKNTLPVSANVTTLKALRAFLYSWSYSVRNRKALTVELLMANAC